VQHDPRNKVGASGGEKTKGQGQGQGQDQAADALPGAGRLQIFFCAWMRARMQEANMIDTYFDRVDAAQGFTPTRCAPVHDDPRYYGGQLYASTIARNAAQARDNLAAFINARVIRHKAEMKCRA
jgi:hypothetical protein